MLKVGKLQLYKIYIIAKDIFPSKKKIPAKNPQLSTLKKRIIIEK